MMVGPIGRKLSVDQDLHRSAATRTGWSASAAAKGEGATVWNRRNLFIHDGFGEGRFTTQLEPVPTGIASGRYGATARGRFAIARGLNCADFRP